MSNLFKQLKKLKNDPKTGALSRSEHETAKARLLSRLSVDTQSRVAAPSYVSWYLGSFISKPVTLGVSAFVLFAGSLSTVNAASGSLPGDTLYSVKRLTEQAQLQWASPEDKVLLHTEFAGRRLDEATQLQATATDNSAHLTLAKAAMQEYASELSQASADLKNLKASVAPTQALAVVSDVQDKIDAMKTVIDQNAATNSTADVGQETLVAKQAAKDAQEAATTVAVEVHETSATELSGQELKEMFKKELGAIEARQTFDQHRLDVIGTSVSANATVFKGVDGIPSPDDLKHMSFVIKQTQLQIPEAMNGFASGGYRTAFATLQGVDSELLGVESKLADIEFLVTATLEKAEADKAEADAKAAEDAAATDTPADAPATLPLTP